MLRRLSPLAIGLAAASLQGCFFDCDDEVTRRALSPDGRWLAAAFVRNCGATTDFATHVVVVEAGDEPDDSGKIFVAEAGSAPRAPQGGPDVRLRWLGADRLEVTYGAGAKIFLQAVRLRGVDIVYRQANDPAEPLPGGGGG